MPEEHPSDDVEKFLSDQKAFEDRKQGLIDDLLKQRAAAIKAFDEKLAKLGYRAPDNLGKPKKNHHKQQGQPAGNAPASPKGKAKA